jgi:hypothetical protein
MLKPTILITGLLLYSFTVRAQKVQMVEAEILSYLSQIDYWDTFSNQENAYDSSNLYNKKLLDYLAKVLAKNPATLEYGFPGLKNKGISILTSADKKFRIYCWDVGPGGGARSSNVILQYQKKTGTGVKVENDVSKADEYSVSSGLYYSAIYTIKTSTGKNVYLANGSQKIALGLYMRNIQAFTIENDTLNGNVKFFKTSKKAVNNINFTFESSLSGGKTTEITVSDDQRKLFIPVVLDDGKATGEYLVYVFDGEKYVYDKAGRY